MAQAQRMAGKSRLVKSRHRLTCESPSGPQPLIFRISVELTSAAGPRDEAMPLMPSVVRHLSMLEFLQKSKPGVNGRQAAAATPPICGLVGCPRDSLQSLPGFGPQGQCQAPAKGHARAQQYSAGWALAAVMGAHF